MVRSYDSDRSNRKAESRESQRRRYSVLKPIRHPIKPDVSIQLYKMYRRCILAPDELFLILTGIVLQRERNFKKIFRRQDGSETGDTFRKH